MHTHTFIERQTDRQRSREEERERERNKMKYLWSACKKKILFLTTQIHLRTYIK